MSTIKEASKQQGGSWLIQAKVVSKQIFTALKHGEVLHLLTYLVVDSNGDTLELKTWRVIKAYTVYRKFAVNQPIEIKGSATFNVPNRKYSNSNYMVYDRWYIEPSSAPISSPRRYLPCVSNVDQYKAMKQQDGRQKLVSVVGSYRGCAEGPTKKTRSGYLLAQGYYVKLADDSGAPFSLLVWHVPRLQKIWPLQNCSSNDTVLLPYAREREDKYKPKGHGEYILTSIYMPIINSDCIDARKRMSLISAHQHVALIATVQPEAYAVSVGS